MAGKGKRFTFHGAFAEKADAVRKERRVGGFIQKRRIRGRVRYVVMKARKLSYSRRARRYSSR